MCVCVRVVRRAHASTGGKVGKGLERRGRCREKERERDSARGILAAVEGQASLRDEMSVRVGSAEAQNGALSCTGFDSLDGDWTPSSLVLPPTTLVLMFPTLSSNDLKVGEFLMSPSFLLIAEPMVEKAAEVFCPAWDSVS